MDPRLAAALLVALVLLGVTLWYTRRGRPDLEALPPTVEPPPAAPPVDPARFAALATALEDGILVVEPDRRVSFANAAAGQLLGLPAARLQGQTPVAVLRDYAADQAVEYTLASGEAQAVTFHAPRSGRMLRLTSRSLADANEVLVVLRDITQLAQLERARRDMVANVSHELRTPLASIRLLVETLAGEPPPEVARRMLGQIDDELTALTQLVDELRELSQIESGRLALKLRPTAVPELVGRAVARLRPQAERHGLALQAELAPNLPAALVDEDRIAQVLVNLLHNAVKFTPPGGAITVRAGVATPTADEGAAHAPAHLDGADWIKLSVQDTGAGIPAGELDRVFERFYKVDRARTRDGGGTGLGLAIAKHLVEGHGGRIWAESVEGRGSTFSLLLPAA